MQLKINPSFRDLIPALSADEFQRLEKSILAEGCREPLSVWNGVIVDGHHRYEICTRNHMLFEVNELIFDDDNDAKIWIIGNQLGRRNLSDSIRGDLAWQQSGMIAEKARARQGARTDLAADRRQGSETGRTAKILSEKTQIPVRTLEKIKRVRDSGNEEVRQKMLKGEVTITKAEELVAMPKPRISSDAIPRFGDSLFGRIRKGEFNETARNTDVNAMFERKLIQKEKPSEEGSRECEPNNHILTEYLETIKQIRLELNRYLHISWAVTSGADEAERQTAEVVDNLTTIIKMIKGA